MRKSEIIYSPCMVNKIRQVDPEFKVMTQRWEQAFGQEVKVEMVEGRLIVKPKEEETK